VTVREATPADLTAVTDLARAAGLPLDGLTEAAVVLVADAGGTVVGTIGLERHIGSDGEIAFLLRSAAVHPDQQRRGIGGQLTRAVLSVVDGLEAPVGLLTETAAGYFLRFGFVAVPRDDLPPALAASPELQGACPATATAMLRTASSSAQPRQSTDRAGGAGSLPAARRRDWRLRRDQRGGMAYGVTSHRSPVVRLRQVSFASRVVGSAGLFWQLAGGHA
jgi:amino-acid N-acetyltransferase